MIKILIIDDDPGMTEIITDSLNTTEFQINTASVGARGAELAKTTIPDIILLDQILPDSLGNNILSQIKQDDSTKHIPIIMYSAYYNMEAKVEAIKNGAIDYIAKYDIYPTMVETMIKKYLEKSKAEDQ